MEALQKRERTLLSSSKEECANMYKGFSKELNDLINVYFSTEDECKCLLKYCFYRLLICVFVYSGY